MPTAPTGPYGATYARVAALLADYATRQRQRTTGRAADRYDALITVTTRPRGTVVLGCPGYPVSLGLYPTFVLGRAVWLAHLYDRRQATDSPRVLIHHRAAAEATEQARRMLAEHLADHYGPPAPVADHTRYALTPAALAALAATTEPEDAA